MYCRLPPTTTTVVCNMYGDLTETSFIQAEVDSLTKRINEREKGVVSPLLILTRSGMGMPVKIKDSVSYCIAMDANDYSPL
ncbi:hypothetical protein MAM1_0565d10932 [Mucor ambiguus]|uniref:Uncharacterized protein n=1 Tax=Mucor ambiguus TaxID=91626 RepID=A0A0C9N9G9_9FUNG|nr:hypothetical protein MAM1_0565d10932 [Mucor ambiguus]